MKMKKSHNIPLMYNCDTVKCFWKQCQSFLERNIEDSSDDICNISHQMVILGFPSNDALNMIKFLLPFNNISGGYNTYNETFESAEGGSPMLVPVDSNLVDEIWSADTENPQPSYPDELLLIMTEAYTGEYLVLFSNGLWAF